MNWHGPPYSLDEREKAVLGIGDEAEIITSLAQRIVKTSGHMLSRVVMLDVEQFERLRTGAPDTKPEAAIASSFEQFANPLAVSHLALYEQMLAVASEHIDPTP